MQPVPWDLNIRKQAPFDDHTGNQSQLVSFNQLFMFYMRKGKKENKKRTIMINSWIKVAHFYPNSEKSKDYHPSMQERDEEQNLLQYCNP